MTVLSFSLSFMLRAQRNGTLVAACASLPIVAAGHDGDSLADKLIGILRDVVGRVESLGDVAEAQTFLADYGVDSEFRTEGLALVGFDATNLRLQINEWAALEKTPLTLQFAIAA